MRKSMDALLTEMKPCDHSTIVDSLIFFSKLEHTLMGTRKLRGRYNTLLKELNGRD